MFAYYRQEVKRQVPEVAKSPIDKFTLGHMAWGGILAVVGIPFWGAFFASVVFEAIENPLKEKIPELFPEPVFDPPGNMVMDTLGVLAGWSLINGSVG